MSKSLQKPSRIKYTVSYHAPGVCFFGTSIFLLEWIVATILRTNTQTLVYLIPACVFLAVGIVLLVQIDSQVYIDEDGIHVTWRNGENLLIPCENLPNCRLIIEGRGLIIYVFRDEAVAEYPELFLKEGLPEREYYLKFALEYILYQIRRGKMTKEDIMTQPIIFLQFGLMGNGMRRFYQKFLLIWEKRQSFA